MKIKNYIEPQARAHIVCYATVAYTRTVPASLITTYGHEHDLSNILTLESKIKVLEYIRAHNQYPVTGDLTVIADEEITYMED